MLLNLIINLSAKNIADPDINRYSKFILNNYMYIPGGQPLG
jgi:hypothetical protein